MYNDVNDIEIFLINNIYNRVKKNILKNKKKRECLDLPEEFYDSQYIEYNKINLMLFEDENENN